MKTVLIIDDDPAFRLATAGFLKAKGWSVLEAGDGDRGLEMVKTCSPDAVLLDLLMPRRNGFQVCRALREDPVRRQIPILVTSGRDFENDRHEAIQAGADHYFVKPLNPDQLLLVLSRLTESSGPATGAAEDRTRPDDSGKPQAAGGLMVRFWGVRGSIPTPGEGTVYYGGNTSCVEVRAEGQIIVLDAGTGLRRFGQALISEFRNQPFEITLLLTHTHWDHIQGLPFFLPLLKAQNRLRVLGYEGARHGLDNLLSSQMDSPFFPIALREVNGHVRIEELRDLAFEVGGVRVAACYANHPGICVGYRLSAGAGSVAFFPDNEPFLGPFGESSSRRRDPEAFEHARQQHASMVQFLKRVDVLIMDAQYDCNEYQDHIGWGHGCVEAVTRLAVEAEVKRLFLFHHDPDHDDGKISEMVEFARRAVTAHNSKMEVDAAREGLQVHLGVSNPGSA